MQSIFAKSAGSGSLCQIEIAPAASSLIATLRQTEKSLDSLNPGDTMIGGEGFSSFGINLSRFRNETKWECRIFAGGLTQEQELLLDQLAQLCETISPI